jgi:hypothetical protein
MLAEEIRGIVECSRLRPEMRRQNGIGNVVGFAARDGAQDTGVWRPTGGHSFLR